ncbi:hypothetical protein SBA2_250030 [Acidobacteriia bacterium SbA2]|nr:hypothetical protein SBA2_250030 [Acidobacteriia bacterium SbA2]
MNGLAGLWTNQDQAYYYTNDT